MAGDDGWFQVARKLQDSDLWLSEPFTRGQAWVDLIGLARFKPGHVRLKGMRIDLQRGQLARSEVSLSERWKRSRGWVRRVLAELETDQRIVQQKTNVTTVTTIINYEAYQSGGTADSTANGTAKRTAGSTADGTQKKNGKNEKNGKKFVAPTIEQLREYCSERKNAVDPERFHDHYTSNGWVVGKSKMKDWQAAVRKWERSDFNTNGSTHGAHVGPGQTFQQNGICNEL